MVVCALIFVERFFVWKNFSFLTKFFFLDKVFLVWRDGFFGPRRIGGTFLMRRKFFLNEKRVFLGILSLLGIFNRKNC